jgi:hypothetical protein
VKAVPKRPARKSGSKKKAAKKASTIRARTVEDGGEQSLVAQFWSYIFGPGPVLPQNVEVGWPAGTEGDEGAAKRAKERQACPPVPSGYHRADTFAA